MPIISNESDSSPNNTDDEASDSSDDQSDMFECNICFEDANDAVICLCGHLFCWPCLHQWLESCQVCPVCNASIKELGIIPIYGHGDSPQENLRNNMPPRPAGQRSELDTRRNLVLSLINFRNGIAAYVDGFFTLFNFSGLLTGTPDGSQLQQDDIHISKWFLYIAVILIFGLLSA